MPSGGSVGPGTTTGFSASTSGLTTVRDSNVGVGIMQGRMCDRQLARSNNLPPCFPTPSPPQTLPAPGHRSPGHGNWQARTVVGVDPVGVSGVFPDRPVLQPGRGAEDSTGVDVQHLVHPRPRVRLLELLHSLRQVPARRARVQVRWCEARAKRQKRNRHASIGSDPANNAAPPPGAGSHVHVYAP